MKIIEKKLRWQHYWKKKSVAIVTEKYRWILDLSNHFSTSYKPFKDFKSKLIFRNFWRPLDPGLHLLHTSDRPSTRCGDRFFLAHFWRSHFVIKSRKNAFHSNATFCSMNRCNNNKNRSKPLINSCLAHSTHQSTSTLIKVSVCIKWSRNRIKFESAFHLPLIVLVNY